MPAIKDVDEFEKSWISLAEEIVRRVMANPEIQRIKTNLRDNGFLSLDEKSTFIVITDKIKYDLILETYGPEGSQGYQDFTEYWQLWVKLRGVQRNKPHNLYEENINHFLFGSTPDPEQFLREFDISEA